MQGTVAWHSSPLLLCGGFYSAPACPSARPIPLGGDLSYNLTPDRVPQDDFAEMFSCSIRRCRPGTVFFVGGGGISRFARSHSSGLQRSRCLYGVRRGTHGCPARVWWGPSRSRHTQCPALAWRTPLSRAHCARS